MTLFNKVRELVLLLVFIFMSLITVSAQNNTASQLLNKLQQTTSEIEKVNLYYELSELYNNKNPENALSMATKSLEIAQRIGYKKGVALGYIVKGEALVALEKFPEALKCEFNSLKISEELKLTSITEKAYSNVGLIYSAMENIPKALYYLNLSYSIAKGPNGTGPKSFNYLDLANVYRKNEQYDSAISYNKRAVEMGRESGDSLTIAIALFNISENYRKKQMFKKSLPYLEQSYSISKNIDDSVGFAFCNNAYGIIEFNNGNTGSSIQYFKKALEQATALKISEVKKNCYKHLYLNYQKLADYKEALNYRNLEIALTDSINSIRKDKEIRNIVTEYQLDKQNSKIVLLEKEKQFKDIQIKSDLFKSRILIIGILLLAGIAFFAFRSYLQKNRLSLQLKQQNKEFLIQNQQLEELNNVKNKLFSIVSHDLRGPIGSIKSILDLMNAGDISADEAKIILPKLSDNLLQTSHLLDNLLYWAKGQMNGIHLIGKFFNLNNLLVQNIRLSQNRASDKNIKMHLETNNGNLVAYGDEATTDIVLRNLLENAIKFSNAGETITISTHKSDTEIIVSVKDNGKGIPYAAQAKIFDGLINHTTLGTANEKGSGLGLLLCKELIENNKGKIWFTSEPGKGSTFSFSMPIQQEAA